MPRDRKTFDVGRDAGSGRVIPVKKAQKRPRQSVVERVPKRGYGDTKPGAPGRNR